MAAPTIDLVPCPRCSAPASITRRFPLWSTGGDVQHVEVICVGGHCSLGPAEQLLGVLCRLQ